MIPFYMLLAVNHLHTTYGYNEKMCGDVHTPRKCNKGATTASGTPFDPEVAIVAVPAPFRAILPQNISVCFKHTVTGESIWIPVLDKKNPRYIGKGGYDLSPAALEGLGIERDRRWSGTLTFCGFRMIREEGVMFLYKGTVVYETEEVRTL